MCPADIYNWLSTFSSGPCPIILLINPNTMTKERIPSSSWYTDDPLCQKDRKHWLRKPFEFKCGASVNTMRTGQ